MYGSPLVLERVPDISLNVKMPANKVEIPLNLNLPDLPLNLSSPVSNERNFSWNINEFKTREFIKLASHVHPASKDANLKDSADTLSLGSSSTTTYSKKVLKIPQVLVGSTSRLPAPIVFENDGYQNQEWSKTTPTHSKIKSTRQTSKQSSVHKIDLVISGNDDASNCSLSITSNERRDRARAGLDDDDDISIMTDDSLSVSGSQYSNIYPQNQQAINSNMSAFSIWASKNRSNKWRNKQGKLSKLKVLAAEKDTNGVSEAMKITKMKKSHAKSRGAKESLEHSSKQSLSPTIGLSPLTDLIIPKPMESSEVQADTRPFTGELRNLSRG